MTTATAPIIETEPAIISRLMHADQCTLIDVREPDEHAREHIPGARLMPLSSFPAASFASPPSQCIVFHCKAGRRSADAARQAAAFAPAGVSIHSMKGGIDAWKAANLPIAKSTKAPGLSVMRQVQLIIGLLTLTGLALGYFIHPLGYLLSAFMGAGLTMAGLTGACPLASLVAKLPWNRFASANSCSTGQCNL